MSKKFRINFPTMLTIVRLWLGFFILPFLIVYSIPHHSLFYNGLLCGLFLLCAATDFFDGYFARKYNQISVLGKMLDPIADKFLMYGVWIALLQVHVLWYGFVLALIGRELLIMCIRQIALEYKFSIHVSDLGKIKTTIHIFFVAFLLLDLPSVGYENFIVIFIYYSLLLLSLWLSWYSAWNYCKEFVVQLKKLS